MWLVPRGTRSSRVGREYQVDEANLPVPKKKPPRPPPDAIPGPGSRVRRATSEEEEEVEEVDSGEENDDEGRGEDGKKGDRRGGSAVAGGSDEDDSQSCSVGPSQVTQSRLVLVQGDDTEAASALQALASVADKPPETNPTLMKGNCVPPPGLGDLPLLPTDITKRRKK